jgi:hypothetical protein
MPEDIDEPTLTAYALGELDGSEQSAARALVEARLACDALLRRQVEEIRVTAQWVSAELAAETMPGLTEIQRAAIERRLEQAGPVDAGRMFLPPRPVRRNWALWGSLAASVVIVCTVMASLLPRLYHLGANGHGDRNGDASPAAGIAPYIVDGAEPPSAASRDLTRPALRDDLYLPSNAGGFPEATAPMERGESAFVRVADSPLCSVPTNSTYPDDINKIAFIAGYLNNHRLPPADSVRIDQIINAQFYHYAVPSGDEAISANIEVAGCPWEASHRLLRVGLRTADATPATRPGTLPSAGEQTVAGLKTQIEFNPAMAGAYRLIGYEISSIAGNSPDGSGGGVGSGFVGAGRSITVLYEVIPIGTLAPSFPLSSPPLKYQRLTPVTGPSRELATVTLRYRNGVTQSITSREFVVTDEGQAFAMASDDFRTAGAAAAFGLALRRSSYRGSAAFDLVIDALNPAAFSSSTGPDRENLLEMAKKAKGLVAPEH